MKRVFLLLLVVVLMTSVSSASLMDFTEKLADKQSEFDFTDKLADKTVEPRTEEPVPAAAIQLGTILAAGLSDSTRSEPTAAESSADIALNGKFAAKLSDNKPVAKLPAESSADIALNGKFATKLADTQSKTLDIAGLLAQSLEDPRIVIVDSKGKEKNVSLIEIKEVLTDKKALLKNKERRKVILNISRSKKLVFKDLLIDGKTEIKYEEVGNDIALDLSEVNFTNATYYGVAPQKATALFKCKEYNFSTQTCTSGNWTRIKSLIGGQNFTIELFPEDPVFTASATVNNCVKAGSSTACTVTDAQVSASDATNLASSCTDPTCGSMDVDGLSYVEFHFNASVPIGEKIENVTINIEYANEKTSFTNQQVRCYNRTDFTTFAIPPLSTSDQNETYRFDNVSGCAGTVGEVNDIRIRFGYFNTVDSGKTFFDFLQVVVNTVPFNFSNISVLKFDTPDPVDVGAQLNYTIHVNSTGNGTAFNVTVNDTYPSQVIFDSAEPTPLAGTNNTFILGNMTPASNFSINITVNVTTDILNGTVITNSVITSFQNETDQTLTVTATQGTTVIAPIGVLNIVLLTPTPDTTTNVTQSTTFLMQANISCTGTAGCGNITSFAQRNTTGIGFPPDWFNTSYSFRTKFTFDQPYGLERNNTHVLINLTLAENRLANENGTLMICNSTRTHFDAYALEVTNEFVTNLEGLIEFNWTANESVRECQLYYDPEINTTELLPVHTGWSLAEEDFNVVGCTQAESDVTSPDCFSNRSVIDFGNTGGSFNLCESSPADTDDNIFNAFCYFKAPTTEEENFVTNSDDSSYLFVNGTLVADAGAGCQAPTDQAGVFNITRDRYLLLRYLWNENTGGEGAHVFFNDSASAGPNANLIDTECFKTLDDEWVINITPSAEESGGPAEVFINISTTAGDTPFVSQDAQPQNCILDNVGDFCLLNWTVEATGAINSSHKVRVNASSNQTGTSSTFTNNATIRIISEVVQNVTVINLSPIAGTQFLLNQTINITANATSTDGLISTVSADVTLPNGTVITVSLDNGSIDIFNGTFSGDNLNQRGQYNITYFANDTDGNINATVTTNFFRNSLDIIDVRMQVLGTTEGAPPEFVFANYTTTVVSNVSGLLNLSISVNDTRIKQINVTLHDESSIFSIIDLDDWQQLSGISHALYGINPDSFNFSDTLTVIVNATGQQFRKCGNWNFTGRDCLGNFTLQQNITPGQFYSFTLNSTDPGFSEFSPASDVALAPFENETIALAFIRNDTNALELQFLQTDGTLIANVTIDTTVDTDSRVSIWPINLTHVAVSWVDGPDNTLLRQAFDSTGANTTGVLTVDTNVGTFTDVSVAQIRDRFPICYANDADNDADFQIFNNTDGTQIVGETSVDAAMRPQATLQNLVECAGVNATRFVYAWFDDQANDISYQRVNETGGNVGSVVDLDGGAGENAQVATTAIDNDKFAVLWYDSSGDNIELAVRDINDNVLLAPTIIDDDPGTESRVALTALRNESAPSDFFVATWFNQSSDRIMAAVFNGTGTIITEPFTIANNTDSEFRLHDVIARDPITNNTLCPGFFVVAYSNSTDQGVFKGFNINTSSWDGICPDEVLPIVSGLIPIAGTIFSPPTITIEIAANVTDTRGVDVVLANITLPNGSLQLITLTNETTGSPKFNSSFTLPGLEGQYNVQIIANDTFNNVNNTETTFFNATEGPAVDIALAPVNLTIFVEARIDSRTGQLRFTVFDTNDSILVNDTLVDATVDNSSRVDVSMINKTHFVIAWVDGPENDVTRQIFFINGSSAPAVINPIDVDTSVGENTDIAVAQLGERFVICYANDQDDDADFRIFLNNGSEIVGETTPDTNMSPSLPLQNLLGCAGVNNSLWVYNWFDDDVNDNRFQRRTDTGASVGPVANLDNNVGETGQTAITALDDDKFAVLFYDSSAADNINLAIKDRDNNTILAPTIIDDDVGTESRVAITAVRFDETETRDSIVAVWWNQSENLIKAAVFNGTGTILTQPFTIGAPDSTFRLMDVAARDPITGNSLCAGRFVVSFSDSSQTKNTSKFQVNGSAWDGSCPDASGPAINDLVPSEGTEFVPSSLTINISANVTDRSGIDTVLANITFPNNTVQQVTLISGTVDIFNNTFTILNLSGQYNITYFANDTLGNTNTETSFFIVFDRRFVDVAVVPINDSIFAEVKIDSISDILIYELKNTTGSVLVSEVILDGSVDNTSRVSMTAINETKLAVAWVDGPERDVTRAIIDINGSFVFGPTDVDTNVGIFTDVWVAELEDRFVVCYAGAQDNDSDFRIFNNTDGTQIVGEISVDTDIAADLNLQNLIGCAAINSTRWVYNWFDDVDSDITIQRRSETGAAIGGGPTDIDAGVGETAQTAITTLDDDKFALLWYDSSAQDNIEISIRDINNNTILAPTIIDDDVGIESRVALATVRLDETETRDSFVAVWWNQSENLLKAAVFNGSGTIITQPFTIEAPDDTFRLMHVTARDPITGNSLCAGRFVIAFSDSTREGKTRQFLVNGSDWDGTCPDADGPKINDLVPARGTEFVPSSLTINISANVTDKSGVDVVLANITFPNNTVQQVTLIPSNGNIFNNTFTILNLSGQYNITYFANDTLGNTNTETSFFIVFDRRFVDVSVAPINDTIFAEVKIDSISDILVYELKNTTGSVLVSEVILDSTVDNVSRVSMAAINETKLAVAWVDGPENDVTRAIIDINGSFVFPPTDVDTNVGANTDVWVAELEDRFVVCYANDADNDADFRIFLNNGSQIVGETNVDTDIAADLPLQNLIGCAAINSTRWVYNWFDDVDSDITIQRRSETGAAIGGGPTDIDAGVGETAQTAITTLDDDKFAILWYDSDGDDNVEISIRDINNNTILAPTVIDDDVGTESRVALATVRIDETETRDSFVAVWWNQSENLLKAAVFNGSGIVITEPFTIEAPDDTFRLMHVTARDPITGNSLCAGRFVIAFSDSTREGKTRQFLVNGSDWDGTCPDADGPAINDLVPVSATSFAPPTVTINISANVTDRSGVDTVLANITFPNSSFELVTLISSTVDIFNNTFTVPGVVGQYNITYIANDTLGNINTETSFFFALNRRFVDVAIVPINDTIFAEVKIDSVANELVYDLRNTTGSIHVSNVILDDSVDNASRVSMAAINETKLAIAWVDGPENDTTRAIIDINGSFVFPPTDVDTNVGNDTDVWVAELGDRFVVCYANAQDEDADFRIFFNNGSQAVGETNVDSNMSPDLPLQNLLGCTGVNSTRWVYNWFDDADNDITYQRRTETGGSFGAAVDVDTGAGEQAQTAIATIDDDKFVVLWFDDGTASNAIRITIRDIDDNILLASTVIDANPGNASRVAVAAVRLNETSPSDSFVAAWYNQSENAIKAAVFNGTGTLITAPFTVDTRDDTFFLMHIAARDPISNNSLCAGRFVIAFTNSTQVGTTRQFIVNGSEWDGVCVPAVNFTSISVVKTDNPDPVTVSSNLTYQINVTNTGNLNANNVTVNDTYPPQVIFLTAQPSPLAGTNNTFILGNMTPNSSILVNITVFVKNVTDGIVINNSVNVTFQNLTGGESSSTTTEGTTINSPPGNLSIVLLSPTENVTTNVTQNLTFLMQASISCIGVATGCGNVTSFAQRNKTEITGDLGDGTDGTLTVTSADTIVNNYTHITSNATVGAPTILVADASEFSADDEILIIQMQNGTDGIAGTFEFVDISSISSNNLTLASTLSNAYFTGAFDTENATITQVVRVPQHTSVTIQSGASIVAPAWNGSIGGIVVFRATNEVNISGAINVSQRGYRGGIGGLNNEGGENGESYDGRTGRGGVAGAIGSNGGGGGDSVGDANSSGIRGGGGGGGGNNNGEVDDGAGGGAGGGYGGGGGGGAAGGDSTNAGGFGGRGGATGISGGGGGGEGSGTTAGDGGDAGSAGTGANAGSVGDGRITGGGGGSQIAGGTSAGGGGGGGLYGNVSLDTIHFGSGGGGGGGDASSSSPRVNGSAGGGIIIIFANEINNTGSIISQGGNASSPNVGAGAGGAGAGGTVYLAAVTTIDLGTANATGGSPVNGTTGHNPGGGGGGGVGRVRLDATTIIGNSDPGSLFNGSAIEEAIPGTFVNISTTAGDTPFVTTDAQPQNCILDNVGDFCQLNWTVNATGAINGTHNVRVNASSNQTGTASTFTNNATVRIIPPVEVAVSVVNLSPIAGTQFLLNQTINITVNATTTGGTIDIVSANVTLPNGTVIVVPLNNGSIDIFNGTFSGDNLNQRGQYNITYFANDTNNNINSTITTNFFRNSLDVIDVRMQLLGTTEGAPPEFVFANYTTTVVSNVSGVLNLSVAISNSRITQVNLTLHDETSPFSILDLDDWQTESGISHALYAIEPNSLNFSDVLTVTVNASGQQLRKCGNWNFSDRDCLGNFTFVQDITPGQLYNFTLNSTDPGFSEFSPAVDVALAPFENETFALAFIRNDTNALEFQLLQTNGSLISNVTIDTTVDIDSRISIWPINFTHVAVSWVDGPDNAVRQQIFNRTGANTTGILTVDPAIGLFTDVSVAQIGDRFPICYANDADNDADFQIFNNTDGTQIIGETSVDGAMRPQATLQNLVECAGVNTTRFVYAWFDDQANDISYQRVNETGGDVGSVVDLDGGAGENAQVAATAIDNDKFAVLWYDSSGDNIELAVRDINDNVLLAPTIIDDDPGTESRVALTALRNESAPSDFFVATWFNQSSDRIMAAVFNGTGSTITEPFTIINNTNSQFRLHDVTARDPITGNTICPGKFIVAYSNSTDQGIFTGFDINGTPWDGICGRPDLFVNSTDILFNDSNPAENQNITINATIQNIGTAAASNVLVQFFDNTSAAQQINGNFTIESLPAGGSVVVNVTYIAIIGNRTILVASDPENTISESDETNNNATAQLNVQAYTQFFGSVLGNLTLDDSSLDTFYSWNFTDSGIIYFFDTDSLFNFTDLQALGRNTTNGTAVNDFGEADVNLGMVGFNDSIVDLWASDNSTPFDTRNFTIFNRLVGQVPIINSSNASTFVTGILWDTGDDSTGEYDISDKEDLIFITNINISKSGASGSPIDYEIHVPSLIRAYRPSANLTAFISELR